MARDDDEKPWTRQLLVSLGALAAVALVIGGVVSAAMLGAAKVAGISDVRPTATAKPSLVVPSDDPTTTVDPYPAPPGGGDASAQPSPSATPSKRPAKPALTLVASPKQVSAGGRITLTGAYRGHEGGQLQVQRFESGKWVDFPVTVTVRSGRYSTYITTGHTGVNRLRMFDIGAGTASAPATVTVG